VASDAAGAGDGSAASGTGGELAGVGARGILAFDAFCCVAILFPGTFACLVVEKLGAGAAGGVVCGGFDVNSICAS
jgi:hypothetical protein